MKVAVEVDVKVAKELDVEVAKEVDIEAEVGTKSRIHNLMS